MGTKIDLTQSAAGEEDPGAALDPGLLKQDMKPTPPLPVPGEATAVRKPAAPGKACPRCGGTGRLGASDCPDCSGSGSTDISVGNG
jgi:hypothetical protein